MKISTVYEAKTWFRHAWTGRNRDFAVAVADRGLWGSFADSTIIDIHPETNSKWEDLLF